MTTVIKSVYLSPDAEGLMGAVTVQFLLVVHYALTITVLLLAFNMELSNVVFHLRFSELRSQQLGMDDCQCQAIDEIQNFSHTYNQ